MKRFDILETIHEGVNTFIHRAYQKDKNREVIIKVLKDDVRTSRAIAKFKYEYEIAKHLDIPGIIKYYELTKYNNNPALILEDFHGISLEKLMNRKSIDLKTFLELSISICEALGNLHNNNIIHRDIKPSNIVVNMNRGIVKIIDLGISSTLTKESYEAETVNTLKGTLAYISPEQTGRINKKTDYRTDIYSLGVTLYEMLTGKLPFDREDPAELVHAHIALKPTPPEQIKPNIPRVISDIVLKCMRKNADERYNSVYGLKYDLERCLDMLERDNEISWFKVGENDIPTILKIPQKLYGRDEESVTLYRWLEEKPINEVMLITVSGVSGIGKTALVNDMHSRFFYPDIDNKIYFASGVFDSFKRDMPYHAIIEAFEKIIRQILTLKKEDVEMWKEKIETALGDRGQVLTKFLPSLEYIIGEQPRIIELSGEEAENRFNMVFNDFLKIFDDSYLYLFFDDMQYIDSASIKLLKNIITDTENKNLTIIGVYGTNEIEASHIVLRMLDELKKQNYNIKELNLNPIPKESLQQLLSDIFIGCKNTINELTNIISEKTYRNPFFVISFLNMIYEAELVWYDQEDRGWKCDLNSIMDMEITDNVAEFMTEKIKHLPPKSGNILRLASCIGMDFDLKTLSYICDKKYQETAEQLNEPIKEGLIMPLGDEYKYATLVTNKDEEHSKKTGMKNGKVSYVFIHEKIYKGAYNLLDKAQRDKLHVKIGDYILNHNHYDMGDTSIKALMHFNSAIDYIKEENDEKRIVKVIRLNIKTAEKSSQSGAFENALRYSRKGRELFSPVYWDKHYEVSFKLFMDSADYEKLFGNFDRSEECLNEALSHVKNFVDKLEIFKGKITMYAIKGEISKAFQASKEALMAFGINIPEDKEAIEKQIQEEESKIQQKLGGRSAKDIFNLKVNNEPVNKSFTEIVTNTAVLVSDYMSEHRMSSLVILKGVNHLLDNGNNAWASYAYIRYSFYLLSIGKEEEAYQWGLMSNKLTEKFEMPSITKSVLNAFALKINQIKNNVKTNLPIYKRAYHSAIKVGNYQGAGTILANAASVMFDSGENLVDTLQYINNSISFVKRIKNPSTERLLVILQRAVMNMAGLTESPTSYDTEDFDEEKFVEDMKQSKFFGLGWYYYTKSKCLLIYGKYEEDIKVLDEYISFYKKMRRGSEYDYFLSMVSLYEKKSEEDQKAYYRKMREIASKSKSIIKTRNNYKCREYLILAEFYRIKKSYRKAISYYDKAIRDALKNNYQIEKALANEFASRFYKKIGSRITARMHLSEAHKSYKIWEAEGKVQQLEIDHHFLNNMKPTRLSPYYSKDKTTSSITITGEMADSLDLSSVIKFSQAISGEIVTERLLKKLMKIVIENGGAQKGYIILNREGELSIEAEGNADKSKVNLIKSTTVNKSSMIPVSIINYVERTKEEVVLSNARTDKQFGDDAYIKHYKPLSLLAIPFIQKGKLNGILYLENRIISGAFTRQRIEVLKLLSAQIAISLENARLYEQLEDYSKNLEKKVEERTKELNKSNRELSLKDRVMQKELKMAKRVQEAIIPEESNFPSTSKLRIASHYSAMEEVGGDLYDIMKIDDAHYGMLISDVSGHGVPAALITTMAKVSFTSHIKPDIPPNITLDMVNEEIYQFIGDLAYFLTAYYCIINIDTGELSFSNSGHHPAILYRCDTGKTERLDTEGYLIGALDKTKNGVASVRMNKGDRLLLFTDGIIESRNKEGKFYTYHRLMDYIYKNSHLPPKEFVNGLVRNLEEFTEGEDPEDDRTILYVEYAG
jgi:predicted ATPase/serine phosphatase RsbU (regulator of sigma subunit)/tRNA A-37 threonylcarbamoyl transferase component Bud32